jgi:hypothetical protein
MASSAAKSSGDAWNAVRQLDGLMLDNSDKTVHPWITFTKTREHSRVTCVTCTCEGLDFARSAGQNFSLQVLADLRIVSMVR